MKKAAFMLKRLITDFNDHTDIDTQPSHAAQLDYYYIKFKESEINRRGGNKPFKFDSNGVPQIHSYIDVARPDYYYYPITIGQYGLAVFHTYLQTREESKKKQFLSISDWFLDNAIMDERLGAYWLTDVDKPEFNMIDPWKSAFSQSRGLSLLLRAWQLTGKEDYFNVAQKAIVPFSIDISEGGVRVGNKGEYFYEEYVAAAPTRILDGAMFSLFGLYDFVRSSKDINLQMHDLGQHLFHDGIEGLCAWLPRFDMGYWVYYNRCEIEGYPQNDPCTIGYLRLVICQLSILHELSGNQTLKEYRDKFASYKKPINMIRMYVQKYKALKKLNRL